MKRFFLIAALAFLFIFCFNFDISIAGDALKPHGPVPIKNYHPLYMYFNTAMPDKAETLAAGKYLMDIDYTASNVVLKQHDINEANYLQLDMEIQRVSLDLKYGLSDELELGLEVPFLAFTGGYLDGFVEGFEDIFKGFTSPAFRKDTEKGGYSYIYRYAQSGGASQTLVNQGSGGEGIGDIVLSLKANILKESEVLPAISPRIVAKLPTGDDSKLLGSGELVYGLGVLMDKQLGDYLFGYLNLDVVNTEVPPAFSPIQGMEDYVIHLVLGYEYFYAERLSTIFQFYYGTTPYPNVSDAMTAIAHDPISITIGFNYAVNDRVTWNISAIENGVSSWPDFSLHTNVRAKF